MKPIFKKSKIGAVVPAVLAMLVLGSCGTQNDPGLNLGVAVSPDKAFVVPGKGISCVAQAVAKSSDSVPLADLTGDRVLFNHFVLQWRSPDSLTIASIKITIFSAGISGADTTTGLETTISEEETAALLGLQNLTIGYANPYFAADGKPVERTINIDSTNSSIKGATSVYAPCGLHIGGIASKVGVKTYNAKIRVEVTGYSTSCDEKNADGTCLSGTQSPVRQTVDVSAQKF